MSFKTDIFGDILTIYLGDDDMETWVRGVGKSIIMPSLLHGCEVIVKTKIETKLCVLIITEIDFKTFKYHISVRRASMEDTLDKIMDWALSSEEYEMCARVQKLQTILNE
jgi:hypothetical protein